jgi:hypothetical protein
VEYNQEFVFWFPGKGYTQSVVTINSDGFAETTLRSLSPFNKNAPEELYGRTLSGQYVSAHGIVSIGSAEHGRALAPFHEHSFDAPPHGDYWSFEQTLLFQSYSIGTEYVSSNNPSIHSFTAFSENLYWFAFDYVRGNDYSELPLFSNDVVQIMFVQTTNSSRGKARDINERSFALRFTFSQDEPLDYALDTWVHPVLHLFEIFMGGCICMNKNDVELDDGTSPATVEILTANRPLVSDIQRGSDINDALWTPGCQPQKDALIGGMQDTISRWIERPNVLNEISGFYSSMAYRHMPLETQLTTAARLVEATYCNIMLETEHSEALDALTASGGFDPSNRAFGPFKKAAKGYEKTPLKKKLTILEERFGSYYDSPSAVDWEVCNTAFAKLRNGFSHGSAPYWQAYDDEIKLIVLAQLGRFLYEANIINTLSIPDEYKMGLISRAHRRCDTTPQLSMMWPSD